MRYFSLPLVALLVTMTAASASSIPNSDKSSSDTDFNQWLQYMAETSDDDDASTPFTQPWSGEGSGLTASQDKDGSLTKIPKVNRDSIGVLPKPTGKAKKVVVAKNGKGDYTTINDAINDIPDHAKYRTIIHIKAGVYKLVHLPMHLLHLLRCA